MHFPVRAALYACVSINVILSTACELLPGSYVLYTCSVKRLFA